MIYIYDQKTITLTWEIYKNRNKVLEDFSRAKVWVFLIADENRYRLNVEVDSSTGCLVMGLDPKTMALPDGTYSVEAVWNKNPDRTTELSKSRLEFVFTLTDDSEKDNTRSKGAVSMVIRSMAATYGYDGLDAYQRAVMIGWFQGSETEWLESLGAHDLSIYYTKTEVDALIAASGGAFDPTRYYTKTEVDELIRNVEADLSDYYTKEEIADLIDGIDVDLSGYYTKEQVDSLIDSLRQSVTDAAIQAVEVVIDTKVGESVAEAMEGLSIPTKTSDLTNDSGFITSADIPSSSSNYIGTFGTINDLPQTASVGNYAYVGTSAPYAVYSYNGNAWSATGATVDTNSLSADEEDITASGAGVLSLKDRTATDGKGLVRIRRNRQTVTGAKVFTDVTYVHGTETTARSAYSIGGTWSDTSSYINGNPSAMGHYGKESGFPYASTTKASVRKAAPRAVLNTTDNKVYFRWQYNKGNWNYGEVWYNGWGEQPSDMDFTVVSGTAKTFARVAAGVTHYYHWTGSEWQTDPTESRTVNLLPTDAFSAADTVYEILYDMDLNGQTITPASGTVIRYAGGKIMNGAINMANGNVIIDCPDVQFFQQVCILNSDSQVLKDVWFDDIFMAISAGTNTTGAATAISLSRNHTVDFRTMYFNMVKKRGSTAYTAPFAIWGGGNRLTVNLDYTYSGLDLFICRYLEVHDLEIRMSDEDIQTYSTIFNAKNVLLDNVKYKGYSRFCCNWARPYDEDSSLTVRGGCDLKSETFLFEGRFNKVLFLDSRMGYCDPSKEARQYTDLISIGCWLTGSDPEKTADCYAEARNCFIGGGWETIATQGINSSGQLTDTSSAIVSYRWYDYIKIVGCELERFSIGARKTPRLPGNTKVTIEDCHIRGCNMPWSTTRISDITFENCYISLFADVVGGTNAGAFSFWDINSATFRGCTFARSAYTDAAVKEYGGQQYPHGYTYGAYTSQPLITIVPPTSLVTASGNDGVLNADWAFRLNLIGNRVIVNDECPYFALRCVNPRYTDGTVSMTAEQAKAVIVCKGNRFEQSAEGQNVAGCRAHLNDRYHILPFDNTIFTKAAVGAYMVFSQANFEFCGESFTFRVQESETPRFGYFNAPTGSTMFFTAE